MKKTTTLSENKRHLLKNSWGKKTGKQKTTPFFGKKETLIEQNKTPIEQPKTPIEKHKTPIEQKDTYGETDTY